MFSLGELLNAVLDMLYFHYHLPNEKGGALHLYKLKSSLPEETLYSTEFGCNWPSGTRGENFLYFVNAISLSLLEKRQGPSFEQKLTERCFVSSGWIGPVVLLKKIKMWKFYRQTDGR